ncbi:MULTISPECIES: hypothetical protein [Haloferacaceae]|uniref:Uncharacterized protein n=1 Tax=Halorubrum glutamatedens TaxID=2707018 RepID=A0ABD5QN48_9EURY|nr:hypothetical protein [Halobellus captivus]
MSEYFEYPAETGDQSGSSLSWDSIRELLEQSDDREKQRLQEELERIEEQIEHREALYREAVERIQSQIDRYTSTLQTLYNRSFGGGSDAREPVKEALSDLYDDLQREKRQHWQDRQSLEQERREILRQLDELDDAAPLDAFL